jgi:uncharacterized membrane protein YdjX (TVP38/TMEM64 family)
MDKKILKNLIRLSLGILVVLGIWWIVKCQCLNIKNITPAAIRDYIQGFGSLAAVVYIVAYVLNTISVMPPIAALSLTAGLVFGSVWGAIYLMIGAMIGTSCTFFISRFFGRRLIEKFIKGRFKNFDEVLEKKGFLAVLFFRVVPVIPYEVLNYLGGFSKMRFKHYFFATFLGLIPGVIIATFFGDALGGIKSVKDLFSIKFAIALGALILIILVPIIYQYVKRKKGGVSDK